MTPRQGRQRLARLENAGLATAVLPDKNKDDVISVADAWLARDDESAPLAQLLAASAGRGERMARA